ncbi:E3 UFM1-protein ligase 1 [Mortierella claussenii]|nr:E3 UFM1-protein ligase 1 [Mortierella claussenii]
MTSTIWTTFFGARDSPEDLQGPASLSETACGDLVRTLVRLGYLSNIVTSLDGNTFITHEQLTRDILAQLEERHGRVSLLDLPKVLNASLSDIQSRVQEMTRTQPGSIIHVQDELLQVKYLDKMTEQMNADLAQQGYLAVMDACQKYQFGIDFIRQFLKERVGSAIAGQWDTVDRGLIITSSFLEREKATLIIALAELNEPTSLQSLRSRHVVQDRVFYGLCEILSSESAAKNTLPGVFRGTSDQGYFVPRPYEQQQTEWIESFFRNNGFIELDAIKKRGVSDPKTYMKSNHPTALILETHAVKESIWSIVDASVEDSIANLSWIDIKSLLPTPFTKEDATSLLRQLPSLKEQASRIAISYDQDHSLTGFGGGLPQETFIVQESIVVTSGQLQKCLLKMGPLLDRTLKTVVSWRLSFGDDQQLDGQDDDDSIGNPYLLGQVGTGLRSLTELNLAQSRSGARTILKADQVRGKKKSHGQKKQVQDFLTIQDIKAEIQRLEPDFDSALANAVAGVLYGDLVQNLKDRNRSVILNQIQDEAESENMSEIKMIKEDSDSETLTTAITSLSKRIKLAARGIDAFEDASVKNSLSKYLLQSLSVELLDMAVLHVATVAKTNPLPTEIGAVLYKVNDSYHQHLSQQMNGEAERGLQSPFVIDPDDFDKLLKIAPQDAGNALRKMRKWTCGSGKQKNLAEFLMTWSHLCEDPNLALQTLANTNEKDNKLLLLQHMQELRRVLKNIKPLTDGALLLHIVTLIAFQKWTDCMLHASGKYVPRILRQLRLTIESPAAGTAKTQLDLLEKMLSSVMSTVKQQIPGGSDTAVERDDDINIWHAVYDLGLSLSCVQ